MDLYLPHEIWPGGIHRPVLILGESTYRFPGDLPMIEYVPAWCRKETDTDYLFSRIFNVCSGHSTENATPEQRREFWQTVGFANFVEHPVGNSRHVKATDHDFRSSEKKFENLITGNEWRGVWVLGIRQANYSEPVVRRCGVPYEVVKHPCGYGVSNEELRRSWTALLEKSKHRLAC